MFVKTSTTVVSACREAMRTLIGLSGMDWSSIDPSIFGTLFERSLDPAKRAQLGAHYTDRSDIDLIVEPVLMAPLREARAQARDGGEPAVRAFHDQLAGTRVLDPACGSGNFLYVSLRALLDLEKGVLAACDAQGWARPAEPRVSVQNVYGIEINPYAHELAQATVWIGYLQWRNENGYGFPPEPILRKLDNIRNMDAILAPDGSEPEWPAVDVILGNPPFLGGKRLRTELHDEYVNRLFGAYNTRVPREADLVCYWFEKARALLEAKQARSAGLIATQGIRGGKNRDVLERITRSGAIFLAWSDKDWILDGAAVHVSIVGFDGGLRKDRWLDGCAVLTLNPDLTSEVDTTSARILRENSEIGFMGDTKGGPFDINETAALQLLKSSGNPNGRPNSDVVRPWINGSDIVGEPRNMWIVDFRISSSMEEASQYQEPFEYVKKHVMPVRVNSRRSNYRELWWLHAEGRPGLRKGLEGLSRYIATPRVSKHRVFAWSSGAALPDSAVIAFCRNDDYFLGVLHARPHEVWSLHLGTQLESRPRYTPTSCFETFPFPWPPGQEPKDDSRVQAIGQAAKELVEKRDRWLQAEDAPPDVSARKKSRAEARTLTNLYNQRPTWLDLAHKKLDAAVFAAYGWPENLSDQDILAQLLALNHERAGGQKP